MLHIAARICAADGRFEAFPQDLDEPGQVVPEADDYLCVWADITDPDRGGRDARHYEVDVRPAPDGRRVHVQLSYGLDSLDSEYAVLLERFVSVRTGDDEAFETEAADEAVWRVLVAIDLHEASFVAAYERRTGGAA
jgi:hypothetical protein